MKREELACSLEKKIQNLNVEHAGTYSNIWILKDCFTFLLVWIKEGATLLFVHSLMLRKFLFPSPSEYDPEL